MLNSDPGKRLSCSQVLNLNFFRTPENFLNENAFSNFAFDVLRSGELLDKSTVSKFNDDCENPTGHLPLLRDLIQSEHEKSIGDLRAMKHEINIRAIKLEDAYLIRQNERNSVKRADLAAQFKRKATIATEKLAQRKNSS